MKSMRRFFAEPERFTESGVTLAEDETRHLRDVLRLQVGDVIAVFDGTGREYHGMIWAINKRDCTISALTAVSPASPESPLELTLAAGVLKGDKFDLIVQKAVELGVSRLVPLNAVRSEIRAPDRSKRTERWRRIALEATKQCGRALLMQIGPIQTVDELLARSEGDEILFFSERGGERSSALVGSPELTAIVGPEGGWDDLELSAAQNAGTRIVTLGGRIMRAETAAIAVAAILQHRLGDLN
jgi:16S rRNA (uracil1498-N3)-methyltransferase